ncbi:MAG TPA: hypothetical protein VKP30_32800, partial [Polyangiaceae bacterium]|nr:hypothetical protein [Polyangiaceae bacterium]
MNTRWIIVGLAALALVDCVPRQKKGGGTGFTRRDPNDGKVVIAAPEAATNKAPPDASNPFLGATFFLNPEYVKEVEDAAAASPA